jgi:hypothetical protein
MLVLDALFDHMAQISSNIEIIGSLVRGSPISAIDVRVGSCALAKLLRKSLSALQLNEHIAESGDVVFRHACQLGYEGIVSKRLGSVFCVEFGQIELGPAFSAIAIWIVLGRPATSHVGRAIANAPYVSAVCVAE